MRHGGEGLVETGKLKGRRFLVPSTVFVENGSIGGVAQYSLACLIHEEFLPSSGCVKCKKEVEVAQKAQPQHQEVIA